jgi:hypothetical protein
MDSIALASGVFQAHLRIHAKGNQLFLARLPIPQPPVFFAVWEDPQIEAAAVMQLRTLVSLEHVAFAHAVFDRVLIAMWWYLRW